LQTSFEFISWYTARKNLQRMRGAHRSSTYVDPNFPKSAMKSEVRFAYLTSNLSADTGITIQQDLPATSSNRKSAAMEQFQELSLEPMHRIYILNPKLGLVRRSGLKTLTRVPRPRVRKLPTPFALSLNQRIPRTNVSPHLLVPLQLGWLHSN
jgi:hypothetical protein